MNYYFIVQGREWDPLTVRFIPNSTCSMLSMIRMIGLYIYIHSTCRIDDVSIF